MEKIYKIFLSSPQNHLKEERKVAIDAILRAGYLPKAMEYFPAASVASWEYIKSVIENCDYFILILGANYGSKLGNTEISFTLKEYEYAKKKEIPIVAFLHENPHSLPHNQHDDDKNLDKFYELVLIDNLCLKWDKKDSLSGLILQSLTELISSTPRIGWIKSNNQLPIFNNHPIEVFFKKYLLSLLNSPYRENVTADVNYVFSEKEGMLDVIDEVWYKCRKVNGIFNNKITWSILKHEFNFFKEINITIKMPDGKKMNLLKKDDFKSIDYNEDFKFECLINDEWCLDELIVLKTAKYSVPINHFISWEMPELSHIFALTIRFPKKLSIHYLPYLLTFEKGETSEGEGHFTYKFFDWVLPNEGLTWQFKPIL